MFDKMMDEIARMTPLEGANLVALDEMAPLGEKLYLLGHFGTKEEAEAEMAARVGDGFEDEMFVYVPYTGPTRAELVAAGIDVDLWGMEGSAALPPEMRAKLIELVGPDA